MRIRDRRRPKSTRWRVQYAILHAAGGPALGGFTDKAARRQSWHEFKMKRRYRKSFERRLEALIAAGRIDLEIDGRRLGQASMRLKSSGAKPH